MKKYLVMTLISMTCAVSAQAAITADDISQSFNKMSTVEKANMALQIATTVENQSNGKKAVDTIKDSIGVDDVSDLKGLGKTLGREIVDFCTEVGIGATKFMESGAAFWIITIGIFYFFGGIIIHVAFGILWFMVTIPLWLHVYRRLGLNGKVTTEPAGTYLGVFPRSKKTEEFKNTCSGDESSWMIVFAAVIILVGLFSIFSW